MKILLSSLVAYPSAVAGPSFSYNIPVSNNYAAGYAAKPVDVHESYGPPKIVHESYGPPKPHSYIQEPHSTYGTPEYNGKGLEFHFHSLLNKTKSSRLTTLEGIFLPNSTRIKTFKCYANKTTFWVSYFYIWIEIEIQVVIMLGEICWLGDILSLFRLDWWHWMEIFRVRITVLWLKITKSKAIKKLILFTCQVIDSIWFDLHMVPGLHIAKCNFCCHQSTFLSSLLNHQFLVPIPFFPIWAMMLVMSAPAMREILSVYANKSSWDVARL